MSIKHKHAPVQPGSKGTVQQHFAQDADLNRMVSMHTRGAGRFGAPLGNPNATRQPRFLDLSDARSYHEMLNTVTAIDTMFARLPARLRSKHRNRPEILMAWLADPANTAEAVKLGLIDDPEVVQAVREAEQLDLEEQAKKAGEEAENPPHKGAAKADPEAQPTHQKVRKSPEGD